MKNGIDQNAVDIITGTSVSYCQIWLKRAHLETIQAALEIERRKRKRTSLIKQLESRARQLEKDQDST